MKSMGVHVREDDMGVIWIKCPATGRQTSTGITADARGFTRFPDQLKSITCPACGMHHLWLREDVWLDEPDGAIVPLRRAG
jgi:hypothetical protein